MSVRKSRLDDDIGNPDALPGSPSWVTFFIYRAQLALKDLDSNVQRLQDLLAKLEKHGSWKSRDYISFETFCNAELKIDSVTLKAIQEAPPHATVRSLLQVKDDAKAAPVLTGRGNPTGKNQHSPKEEKLPSNNSSSRGNSDSYLSRRLKRDAPEIFDKLETYPSMRAAAIEAGIIKFKTIVVIVEVERAAKQLKKHFTVADLAKLKDLL